MTTPEDLLTVVLNPPRKCPDCGQDGALISFEVFECGVPYERGQCQACETTYTTANRAVRREIEKRRRHHS